MAELRSYSKLLIKLAVISLLSIWIARICFYFFYPEFRTYITQRELFNSAWVMLRFDLSTIAMMVTPSFLVLLLSFLPFLRIYWIWLSYLISIPSFWLSIGVLWADTIYYEEAGRHLTFEVGAITHDKWTMFKLLVNDYPIALIIIIAIYWLLPFLLYLFYRPLIHKDEYQFPSFLRSFVWTLIHVLILFTAVRGGWQLKPLRTAYAFQTDNVLTGHLVLNGFYTFVSSQFARKGVHREWMPTDSALSITKELISEPNDVYLNPRYPLLRSAKLTEPLSTKLEKPNVVIIVIESLTADYLKSFGGSVQTMPFLDSLASQCVIFTNCYAVGTRSMEGLSAIFGGIPNLMGGTFIGGEFEQTTLRGLGSILTEEGYSSKFVHAATAGSMGIRELARVCGYPVFYSKEDFPKREDDGQWGVWDRYVLKRISTELDTMTTPSHYAAFTLSTHSPFLLPEEFQPPFSNETPKAAVFNSFANLDTELRRFFAEEQLRPRFRETIYLIIGDHTTETNPEIQSRYRVGCLFYAPFMLKPSVQPQFVSQISIIPTVLQLIHSETPHSTFGKSFFSVDVNSHFAYFAYPSYIGFARNNHILLNSLDGDIKLFNPIEDPYEQVNLLEKEPELANSLRRYAQGYYQTTIQLLSNNRVYPTHQDNPSQVTQ